MRELVNWRKRKGLTQVKLAELLGCDQSTVSAIERGARPSVELLRKIVEVLEVESDDLKGALLSVDAEAAPQ